jgi:hypothetical protein
MPSGRPLIRLRECAQPPTLANPVTRQIQNWRGRNGNDPSVDIAKDADHRLKVVSAISTPYAEVARHIHSLFT